MTNETYHYWTKVLTTVMMIASKEPVNHVLVSFYKLFTSTELMTTGTLTRLVSHLYNALMYPLSLAEVKFLINQEVN